MTRHFLAGEAQARYTAARIDAIRAIGRVARDHEAQFVVVAGDVFESNFVAPATVLRALDAMASIGLPVYLLAGNHDALDAASIFRTQTWQAHVPPSVHVLSPGLTRAGDSAEIVAAPYPDRHPRTDLLAEVLAGLDGPGELPRIAVAHGTFDVLDPSGENLAAMRLAAAEQALAEGTVQYIAVGDKHTRQQVGRTGQIHYSGTSEVTSFREELPGDVLVVDVDAAGAVSVTPVHVGTWRFVTIEADLFGRDGDGAAGDDPERGGASPSAPAPDDIAALDARLAALDPKDRIVVRTVLRGALTLRDKARLDAVLERYGQSFAGMFAWERHTALEVLMDGLDVEQMDVSGFVESAARELAGMAGAGAGRDAGGRPGADGQLEAATARDALSLLFRLTEGARR